MRRLTICIFLFAALFGLSACGENHSWRQKLVLEVETPSGIVSGGSVVEVSVHWFGSIEKALTAGNGVSSAAIGEASFVEVAPGKFLFALSVTEPLERTLEAFRSPPDERNKPLTARLETARERRILTSDHYPKLVTFDDIYDPKSVTLVDPADLAATFGTGFALKSIAIEITDDDVTDGKVETVLGWWCEYRAKYFVDRYAPEVPNQFARNIGGSDFRIGECE